MRLERQIKRDLNTIGLEIDFELELRGYSKRLEGTYDPNISKIIIYAREKDGMLRNYSEILEIAIHEAIHHLQWKHDPSFVRRKGIMHNASFHRSYNKFTKIAEEEILGERYGKEYYKDMGKDYRLSI